MFFAGVDIGAVATKTVIINKDGNILVCNIIRTGANSKASAEKSMQLALEEANLDFKDLAYVIATGYGRINAQYASRQVSEISCHALGAHFLFSETRTIIDIGGQDCKAIRVNEKGEVLDFAMNDKCAAGTGRFLEVMADALEIEIEKLGELSLQSKNLIEISSMCTVFAESEVVSLIAEGVAREDIARGLHNAVVDRILGLANKVRVIEEVTLTGGVINNIGVVHALKSKLGISVNIPQEPQIVGALGAALAAMKYYRDGKKLLVRVDNQEQRLTND